MSHIYHETKWQSSALNILKNGTQTHRAVLVRESLLAEGFVEDNNIYTRHEPKHSVMVKLTPKGVMTKAYSQIDDELNWRILEWGPELENLWKEIEHCRWLEGYGHS